MDTDLLAGERILWEGRPQRLRLFRRTDALLVAFNLLWLAFALVWTHRQGNTQFYRVATVLFVTVGLLRLVSPFVGRAAAYRHIRYTVTDRRVLIRGGWRGRGLGKMELKKLPRPVIVENAAGGGSLAFGEFPEFMDAFDGFFSRRRTSNDWSTDPSGQPILWDIQDVRIVRDHIVAAQAA